MYLHSFKLAAVIRVKVGKGVKQCPYFDSKWSLETRVNTD